MKLHFYNEIFRELVELATNYFGYEQSHVEKDYWISKILKELTSSKFSDNIYFKGGTSLFKAHQLITRFSEDLDIFVYTGNPVSSKQAEKTLTRNVSHFVIENNQGMYVKELSKTGGDFRKLTFSYDTHYESAGLKENLEVEIKCCILENKSALYYPMQKRKIQSIIAEYLQTAGHIEIISRFELDDFEIQTIDPKRTLCDKISRLTRLSYNNDFEILIAKHIRDIYDIYCMLKISKYQKFIKSDEFVEALQYVTNEDGLYRNSQSHQSISKAKIFAETKHVLYLPAVFHAYNNELKQLMFDVTTLPTLDDVIQNIMLLQQPLCRFDEKYRSL
ncbi:MAG: nucleotidyl transferase AbiEii/AbiGii toxin family protein [Prevotellaceae bacterium]|jgi:predicted nucleotidyltransferase component of viral defense system|nr:nucleotidyl transferase AbiEii/AbiGii toxin family protein [Prevotellaceae bacterium]